MSAPSPTNRGRLALAFEEVLTTVGRLRDQRQVPTDAHSFREHVKGLLAEADEKARRMGYPAEFAKGSVYASVALLDESVLATPGPLASTWAGRPLQEEIFGDFVAGESFFQQLDDLLNRQDSTYVADVLEVYLLCLYMGFRGRYSSSDGGHLQGYMRSASDKILRTRGGFGPLAPYALPPTDEGVRVTQDPIQGRLAIGVAVTAAGVAVTIVLLRLFSVAPGIRDVQGLVTSIGL